MSATVQVDAVRKPELLPVWTRIREHLERFGWQSLGSLTVDLDDQQALAMAALLGAARMRSGRVRLDLARLDAALRASRLEVGVVDVVQDLGGPMVDRRQIRLDLDAERKTAWGRIRTLAETVNRELLPWLERVRSRGIARRVAGDDYARVLEQVISLVGQLPAQEVPLQRLAVRVGSAHDLDWDQPLGSLALSALAYLAGQDPPSSALDRRQLWAKFGVVLDSISATVLALNLQPSNAGLAADILRSCAQEGEPASLTLGQLRLNELVFPAEHAPVLVCENPAVMEDVKAQLGVKAPPMVCVAGRLNTAASQLLHYLAAAGVTLRYRGDFDYPGIAIANEVIARFRAEPWRFDTAAYLAALARNPGHPPKGRRVEASWDPNLAASIAMHQRAIHEEALVEDVLAAMGGSVSFGQLTRR